MNKVTFKYGSKYKRRLFFSIFLIVLTFSILIGGFQYQHEKKYRKEKLESILNIYAEQIHSVIQQKQLYNKKNTEIIDTFKRLIPDKTLRITIISQNGNVLYDSYIKNSSKLDNHLQRPEIQKAISNKKGSNIRYSVSTKQNYYYYAKQYNSIFIRTALPFNSTIISFLKVNHLFLYFLIALFGVTIAVLIYVAEHFGSSLAKLRQFAIQAAQNKPIDFNENFGQTELGEISSQIMHIYQNLTTAKEALSLEKEKLFLHFQTAQEGVAIFDNNKNLILWNSHFIAYMNYFITITSNNYKPIFEIDELSDINTFIDKNIIHKTIIGDNKTLTFQKNIHVNHKIFLYQVVIFPDNNFEISINDITKSENEKNIKQEMTLNIAHELKTPVTAVSGFLETIMEDKEMPEHIKTQFIERSVEQINRLLFLIQDMAILSKMEESNKVFTKNKIDINILLNNIVDGFELKLQKNDMHIMLDITPNLTLNGNSELMDSIFRNLIDNSIKYAGNGTVITITNYFQDDNYHYFSYTDNGIGISELHLARIFERFYRVDTGRSRKMGGTGLGLSIVKNAITFHNGKIFAKPATNGGIAFFFTLKK